MRKIGFFILCSLLLVACKEDPIPVVKMEVLPAELVYSGETMEFDTTWYQQIEIIRDTITPDSIVVDTLRIDTFALDTFWTDIICLVGTMSCVGNPAVAPALQEYGFCINDYMYYPLESTDAKQTPIQEYDTFYYVMPMRYDSTFYVHTYAVNPSGTIRSATRAVIMTKLDPREQK